MTRVAVWLVLALPGAWMLGRWALTPDSYGYGHFIGDSGDWAAWLLMATLAVTPLRLIFDRARWTGRLLQYRRELGVASFAYAAAHTVAYLWRKASWELIVEEAGDPYLIAGWAALALFVPLAFTSNDASMRWLKRSWKRLHRLVYPAAILTFAHWVLSAFDPTTAWLHIAALAAIEIVRVVLQAREKRRA